MINIIWYLLIGIILLFIGVLLFNPFDPNRNNNEAITKLVVFCVVIFVMFFLIFNKKEDSFLTDFEKLQNKIITEKEITQEEKTPVNPNEIILDTNDSKIYNIKLYDLSEYDFLTKKEIFNIRQRAIDEASQFIKSGYAPREEIFNIVDKKPWWGTEGILCKGQGQPSIQGLSRESSYVNNPLMLIDLNLRFAINGDRKKPNCANEWVYPTKLTVQPSKKTFTLHYDVSNFLDKRQGSDFMQSFKESDWFAFDNVNARDFGYEYAIIENTKNIRFTQADNPTNSPQKLVNYIHLGQSCQYEGGCNNISPANDAFAFYADDFPSYAKFKLYKQSPAKISDTPDVYFEIYLD